MTQVDFYHLQKQSLENVLPKLLEKAYATGKPIKVKVGNEERVEFINSALWSYEEKQARGLTSGFAFDQLELNEGNLEQGMQTHSERVHAARKNQHSLE